MFFHFAAQIWCGLFLANVAVAVLPSSKMHLHWSLQHAPTEPKLSIVLPFLPFDRTDLASYTAAGGAGHAPSDRRFGTNTNWSPVPFDSTGPFGRRLATTKLDWCGQGKNASGVHTLLRGTTCTLSSVVYVAPGTSLSMSSGSGPGSVAVISGNGTTGLFHVDGNLTVTDLILERGYTDFGGAS